MNLKPHLRYASYVVRHKAFVAYAGWKHTGAPVWRLVIHDWSKMSPAEWGPYVRTFYDPDNARAGEFDEAWLHHQHHNPHHWQHWVLRNDDGSTKPLDMPLDLVREMVADWMGAGRAITGEWKVGEWYLRNVLKLNLSLLTQRRVERMLKNAGQLR